MYASYSAERRRYYRLKGIFLACFFSFIGLAIFLLCRSKVPFWGPWRSQIKEPLFFLALTPYVNSGMLLSLIGMVFNQKDQDPVTWRKWRNWLNRICITVISLGVGVWTFWDYFAAEGILYKLLLLVCVLVSAFLVDFLIQFLNKNGICDGFSLLFFAELITSTTWLPNFPHDWAGILRTLFLLFALFSLTAVLIYCINVRWEAPIQSSSLPSLRKDSFFRKKKFNLGFRFKFSYTSIFYFSQILSIIFNVYLIFTAGGLKIADLRSLSTIRQKWFYASQVKTIFAAGGDTSFFFGGKTVGFFGLFLFLNNIRAIFDFKEAWKVPQRIPFELKNKNLWIVASLLLTIILRLLILWMVTRQFTLNSREMTKDLRARGLYIEGVPPGKLTYKVLTSTINKMVIYWFLVQMALNILFDNFFALAIGPAFTTWFSCTSLGEDLINQVRTRVTYYLSG